MLEARATRPLAPTTQPAEQGRAARQRRVLLVAPWYPPSSLPPAQRARLYAEHLGAFGWSPVVVAVRPSDREEEQEHALTALAGGDAERALVRALPAAITRRVGIGDIALRAMPFLLVRIVSLARRERADAICLLVPPWYLLLLAPLLRRTSGVPIVVDYIDPWVLAPRPGLKHRLARAVAGTLEGWTLRSVDGIFSVSSAIGEELVRRFPWLDDRPRDAAPYGLEPTDFAAVGPPERTDGIDSASELLYIGSISASMEPVLDAFLEAVALLRERDPDACARLGVSLVGTSYHIDGSTRPRSAAGAAARGLGEIVHERLERVPYTTALRMMRAAAANIIIGDMTDYYAASKLMPMLAAGRPIVALLEQDSEPARLLRHLGAPGLICYSATDPALHPRRRASDLADVLARAVRGELAPIAADFEGDPMLRARTARTMTRALAGVLDRVSSGSPRPSRP